MFALGGKGLTSCFFLSFAGQSSFRCPEPNGYFEDVKQCDKYYDCQDGVAEERLCPDGLVFDPFSRKREPCDHYFNVDCGDRLELRKFDGVILYFSSSSCTNIIFKRIFNKKDTAREYVKHRSTLEYDVINIIKKCISAPTRALQYQVREQYLVACKKLHKQLFACHDSYQARVFSLQIND
jgi:hypothetical protein